MTVTVVTAVGLVLVLTRHLGPCADCDWDLSQQSSEACSEECFESQEE